MPKLSVQEKLVIGYMEGDVRGPELYAEWQAGHVDDVFLRTNLGKAWSEIDQPESDLDHAAWRTLFAAAGYTLDGEAAHRPTETLTLWRGSHPQTRDNWSWSSSRDVAEWFAGRWYHQGEGRLYQIQAPPHALLAQNSARYEFEYVVDTAGLAITEVPQSIESVMYAIGHNFNGEQFIQPTIDGFRCQASIAAQPFVEEAITRLIAEGFLSPVPQTNPQQYDQIGFYPRPDDPDAAERMEAWRREQRAAKGGVS
ncbi:hypothetical protein ACPYPG_21140 [Streptomyces sp. FR-108]|uniref:hypothetical protein n=1 Tax=Streptomyces sp. FR-108 TaxID=3416665 RepID=UPI003CF31C48